MYIYDFTNKLHKFTNVHTPLRPLHATLKTTLLFGVGNRRAVVRVGRSIVLADGHAPGRSQRAHVPRSDVVDIGHGGRLIKMMWLTPRPMHTLLLLHALLTIIPYAADHMLLIARLCTSLASFRGARSAHERPDLARVLSLVCDLALEAE